MLLALPAQQQHPNPGDGSAPSRAGTRIHTAQTPDTRAEETQTSWGPGRAGKQGPWGLKIRLE